jgi:hypothetical protein
MQTTFLIRTPAVARMPPPTEDATSEPRWLNAMIRHWLVHFLSGLTQLFRFVAKAQACSDELSPNDD